jgi:hypothetical protein
MYKSKIYYKKNIENFNNLALPKIYNKLIETIINNDKINFNIEYNNLNKIKYFIKTENNINKLFEIIKNNFDKINNLDEKFDTDLKLEYLQYLITFDINESNGIFLDDKLEISKNILKENNNNLKY